MLAAHFAAGFAAKRAAPTVSLGTLLLAGWWLDALWAPFVLLGWEHLRLDLSIQGLVPLDLYWQPFSHSLLALAAWMVVVGLVHFSLRRDRRAALVVAACVASHWFLDLVVHRPDLPLWPGSAFKAGLSLWNSAPGTLLVESGIYLVCVGLYARATSPRSAAGAWGFWVLAVALYLVQLRVYLGPPPPTPTAAATTLSLWIVIAWGYWLDRLRPVATGS